MVLWSCKSGLQWFASMFCNYPWRTGCEEITVTFRFTLRLEVTLTIWLYRGRTNIPVSVYRLCTEELLGQENQDSFLIIDIVFSLPFFFLLVRPSMRFLTFTWTYHLLLLYLFCNFSYSSHLPPSIHSWKNTSY